MGQRARDHGNSLTLSAIEVEGFISYEELTRIELQGGVLAIVGKNGVGKSTIISKALSWCLYSKCAPERMGSGAQSLRGKSIVNRRSKCARVRCEFDRGRKSYVIERTRTKSKASKVKVWIDGVESDSDPSDIVGASYEVFTRTVVRGQNDPWNFAEATDAKKREIIDEISGASQLRESHQRAKDAVKSAKRSLGEVTAALKALERQKLDMPLDSEELWLGASLIEDEIKALKDRNRLVQAALDNLGPEPQLDLSSYQNPHHEALKVARDGQARLAHAQSALATLARVAVGHACPTCGEIVRADSTVAQNKYAAEQAVIDASKYANEADRWSNHCKQALDQAQVWLAQQQADWRAKRDLLVFEDPAALQAKLDAQRSQAEQADAIHAKLDRDIRYHRASLVQYERDIRIAQGWEAVLAPRGVPAHLAESALSAIAAEANRWVSILSDGSITVDIESIRNTGKGIKREEITIKATWHGEEQELLQFSGGQRARINLAVDLGVAAVFGGGGSLALSLLVLDEQIFSGLDLEGQESVVEAINAAGVRDVVVIDHAPNLVGVLSKTIEVSMTDRKSSIKEIR